MDALRAEVLESLRRYVDSYQASVIEFARHMGLPLTDGNALGEVLWAERAGAPLSPSALASRIAITSGATNALVNRLEAKGLVARSREHDDRRVVTLRATEAARATAEPFLSESAGRLTASLATYDDADLVLVRDFIDRFAAVLPRG
ncbi:MarR family winged helix-turn-helix transcriptional regulator [Aeromicrobium alkaliterrae]|uniref:HTH marR-type domain-containing protein n=1 Tax=Aeromicrobium alkaliterrae TaxID=302168 RepID=A0ABN2K765_9ACTN